MQGPLQAFEVVGWRAQVKIERKIKEGACKGASSVYKQNPRICSLTEQSPRICALAACHAHATLQACLQLAARAADVSNFSNFTIYGGAFFFSHSLSCTASREPSSLYVLSGSPMCVSSCGRESAMMCTV